ncbi:uncharacterized protein TA14980 [Theileria annulata]|uniref:Brl1/Brr6 domain-containing protein n=1 Tax=Theileria annulata TaxID=5874 RepID=Q4UFW0_THEAN|nr:uncharacterized protein TA14980 [Theileria annulata]CAI74221.1 hypothetical protein, conserved [Theileria annulata]|eukprot:XP_951953.1 hypothetical protein, conserved [Theileria annulata]
MLEELNLNDELKSLKISNSNSFLPSASDSKAATSNDTLDSLNGADINNTAAHINTNIKLGDINTVSGGVDDDVLLTGYNIFVKLEKPIPDTVSYTDLTNPTDPANTHDMVDMDNSVNGHNTVNSVEADSTIDAVDENNTVEKVENEKKSGWLMSSIKRTPKAHYVKNLKDLKKGKKNELQLFHPKNRSLSSQSSTVSTHTNNTHLTNNSHKFQKLYCQTCNKHNPLSINKLNNYNAINPYVNKYLSCSPILNDGYSNDFVWDNNERNTRTKFDTENINNWLKTILNIIVTFILIYILIVIFIILRKDIINHINNNKTVVHNKSQVCFNEYTKNKCNVIKIPAMESKCKEWELCMKKDSLVYEDVSSISVEIIGSLINKLISQLDLKAILFLIIIILLVIIIKIKNRPKPDNQNHKMLNKYYVPNYKNFYPYT